MFGELSITHRKLVTVEIPLGSSYLTYVAFFNKTTATYQPQPTTHTVCSFMLRAKNTQLTATFNEFSRTTA
jgi:hypothetical protein